MAGEAGEVGGVEGEGNEQERGDLCSAIYQKPSWGKEKSPNEEWRVHIPSSIDVRPTGEKGTNAYALMGSD